MPFTVEYITYRGKLGITGIVREAEYRQMAYLFILCLSYFPISVHVDPRSFLIFIHITSRSFPTLPSILPLILSYLNSDCFSSLPISMHVALRSFLY